VLAAAIEFLHMLVTGLNRKPARESPAGQRRDSCRHQSHQSSAIECLVEIARLVKLLTDVTLFHFLIELAKRCARKIVLDYGSQYRFSRKHSRFDRSMNSFQSLAVEHPRSISDDHNAVGAHLRHRVPPADRHRLSAVANHLAAF